MGISLDEPAFGLTLEYDFRNVAKTARIKSGSKVRSITAFIVGLVIAGYGVWAFIGRDFPTYLFLKSEFVFWITANRKFCFI